MSRAAVFVDKSSRNKGQIEKVAEEEEEQNEILENKSGVIITSPFEGRDQQYCFMYSNESMEEANFVYDDFNIPVADMIKQPDFIAHDNAILPSNLVNNDESTIPHQEEDATDSCSMSNSAKPLIDSIPVIRELMALAEADAGGAILFSNFFKLLRKLKLTYSQFEARRIFEKINKTNGDSCSHEQFFLFFSREIKTINLQEISVTELIFRLGLELFRVLGREKLMLELRDIMSYNKKYRDLDIDFIQLMEMFEFYDNVYSGVIKRKQTIVQFFQNCVIKLAGAIKGTFVFQLQDLLKNSNQQLILQQSKVDSSASTLKLKVYGDKEKEVKNIQKRVLRNVERKLEKESLQGLLQKNFNLNFQVAMDDGNFEKEDHVESEIEDYFQENRPKNKGWLFRKSKKHQNKWSNLFFYIYHDDSHLVSVKPTSLKVDNNQIKYYFIGCFAIQFQIKIKLNGCFIAKREMYCEQVELFKCSFIEILGYQETKKACMERRKCRNKNNFMSVTEGEKPSGIGSTNSNEGRTLTHQSTTAKQNEMQNFFLHDKTAKKHYLIRSEESLIIMSIVSFYNKTLPQADKSDKVQMAELAQTYSEYSGIIEIALCKKEKVNQSYADLSAFSFKPQYLIIKQGNPIIQDNLWILTFLPLFFPLKKGNLRIYNIKQKDKINLMEYELKIDSQLPFTPSNPFSFVLEKIVKQPENMPEEKKRDDVSQISEKSSVVMFNPLSGNSDQHRSPGVESHTISKPQKLTEQKPKQGLFAKFFSRIYKKAPERLVLAADSEYKRKQWIFTINFHKTLLVKMKKKNKASFGYYQSFNTNQFFSNFNTLENENIIQQQNTTSQYQQAGQIPKRRGTGSHGLIVGFNGGDHNNSNANAQGKLKLSEIEGENDYYDIFAQRDIVEEVKEEEDEHNEESPQIPYKYDPADNNDVLQKASYQNTNNQKQEFTRPSHSRQGSHPQTSSFQNPLNLNNMSGNNRKNSFIKSKIYTNTKNQERECNEISQYELFYSKIANTEDGMYTMNFPINNPLFKKSLLVSDPRTMIPNSKEIRTITDEEVWQKFLKHFLSTNHEYSEIDLSALTSEHLQHDNIHSDQKTMSNYSSGIRKTDNLHQDNKISNFEPKLGSPFNKDNLTGRQFLGTSQGFRNALRKNESSKELKSTKNYYVEEENDDNTEIQQPSRNDEVEEEDEEPQAQSINFRNTFVHKLN